jgi:hypothetical protein
MLTDSELSNVSPKSSPKSSLLSKPAAVAVRTIALRKGRNEIALPTPDLRSGAYILRAKAGGITQTLKFILAR